MIFSGHTCFLTLVMMVFVEYCRDTDLAGSFWCSFIRRLVILTHAIGITVIVGTKLHYTLDVFLAVLLTVVAWRSYHHAIEHSKLKAQFAVLQWLEAEEVMRIDDQAFENFEKTTGALLLNS